MSKKLNIIFINDHAYHAGGIATVAISEAENLKKLGHHVLFFSNEKEVAKELNEIETYSLGGQDLKEGKNIIQGIYNSEAHKKLNEILKKFSPQDTIIHVHSWSKGLSYSVILAARKMGFKIVLTIHDYFLACPNGGFLNYQKKEICHLKPLSPSCLLSHCDKATYLHKLWRYLRTFFQNKIHRIPSQIDQFISCSHFAASKLKSHLGNPDIHVLYNPIDIEKPKKISPEKNNIFLFVGRLSPEKGCLEFAQVAKELNLDCVFVGDGELKNEILSILPNAKITGWQKQDQVFNFFQNARCLVFPSLWYEALPLTPLQTMAYGLPVLTSNCNAATEYITHQKNGWVFEHHLKNDNLKNALQNLKEDDSLISKLSENAFEWFWQNDFSSVNHAKKLLEIYEKVLKKNLDQRE